MVCSGSRWRGILGSENPFGKQRNQRSAASRQPSDSRPALGLGFGMTQTTHRGSVADGVYGGAKVVDHIGPLRHPHRVTIMQLARARETYELRWRELVRGDDGAVTRERRRAPGGNSKAAAYER